MKKMIVIMFSLAMMTSLSSVLAQSVPSGCSPLLYDQRDGGAAGASIISDTYPPPDDNLDSQGADDFLVPSSGWSIDCINFVGGTSGNNANLGISITIYADAGGLPGAVQCNYQEVPAIYPNDQDFIVVLPTPCSLGAGTYWVSGQANLDNGNFNWNTTATQRNNPAVWQNPLGGQGLGCTTWTSLSTCITNFPPDFKFQIYGGLPTLHVDIDIKPGSDPNCFNNNGNGVIPVAILGSDTFDVGRINPASIELAGMSVRIVGKKGNLQAHIEDTNEDGFDDFVVQIQDEDGVFEEGNGTATLTGELIDGTAIEGTDAICVVQ